MTFDETINTMLLILYVIGIISGGFAAVGTIADIFRGRRPSRGGTIFALSMLVCLAVWSLVTALGVWLLAIGSDNHTGHAVISLCGLFTGFFALILTDDRLGK